jgi:hypothetical protein
MNSNSSESLIPQELWKEVLSRLVCSPADNPDRLWEDRDKVLISCAPGIRMLLSDVKTNEIMLRQLLENMGVETPAAYVKMSRTGDGYSAKTTAATCIFDCRLFLQFDTPEKLQEMIKFFEGLREQGKHKLCQYSKALTTPDLSTADAGDKIAEKIQRLIGQLKALV